VDLVPLATLASPADLAQYAAMQPDIFFIPVDASGRLAQMPHPRTGNRLKIELTALRDRGVDRLVSLLAKKEADALGLHNEGAQFERLGGRFSHFPIRDLSPPMQGEVFFDLADTLLAEIRSGATIAIHCRAGIGRSTLLSCSVLCALGRTVDDALALIALHRGLPVPDTEEQAQWLRTHLGRLTWPRKKPVRY